LFAVPDSAMADWVRNAGEVVVIDGCHLKCHRRIVEHLVDPKRLRSFNALAQYRKFNDLFDIDAVPEAERRDIADDVARWVLDDLQKPAVTVASDAASSCASLPANESAPENSDGGSGTSNSTTARSTSHFTPQAADLVGIGAAVAANCEACLEHHSRNAEQHGISREDMGRAVALAIRVKDAPHQKILAAAERLTRPVAVKETPVAAPCCGGANRNKSYVVPQVGDVREFFRAGDQTTAHGAGAVPLTWSAKKS
jgi:AhpD family alkylhydroperoxidase